MIASASILEESSFDGPAEMLREASLQNDIDALVARGAVLSAACRPTPLLIGDVRWVDSAGVMFFSAYGDGLRDVTWIRFDRAVLGEGEWRFHDGVTLSGTISGITSALADADDHRIAWELWQQVLPLKRNLIAACFDKVEDAVLSSSLSRFSPARTPLCVPSGAGRLRPPGAFLGDRAEWH